MIKIFYKSRAGQTVRHLFCNQKIKGANPLPGSYLYLVSCYRFLHKWTTKYINEKNFYPKYIRMLKLMGIDSACLKEYPFPLCISVNGIVCHGNILNKKINDKNILNIDICLKYKSFYIDGCRTYMYRNGIFIPNLDKIKLQHTILMQINNNWGNVVSYIKEKHCTMYYYVHGLDNFIHSKPFIKDKTFCSIEENKSYAVEVMWSQSSRYRKINKWCFEGNQNVFHTEDTVFVTKNNVYILTYDEEYHKEILV